MTVDQAPGSSAATRTIEPGMILIDRSGRIKIVRSRNAADDGWNCADGAGLADVDAGDGARWTPYTPDELAAALSLAAEVRELGGHRELGGGLATWDACSGRPCVLPKLAKVVRDDASPLSAQQISWLPLDLP